jgi:hypothetical protein
MVFARGQKYKMDDEVRKQIAQRYESAGNFFVRPAPGLVQKRRTTAI